MQKYTQLRVLIIDGIKCPYFEALFLTVLYHDNLRVV